MSTADSDAENGDEQTSPVEGHADGDSIDELEATLSENDYTGDELLAALDYEEKNEGRKGAIDALADAYDEETSGPTQPDAEPDPAPTDPDRDDDVGGADAGAVAVSSEGHTVVTAMDTDVAEADEQGTVEWNRGHGAGATGAGQPGVVLPSPYGADAPETVTVSVPVAMGIAGEQFDTSGEHTIPYSMPAKLALETETNLVVLAASDPLHPSNREDEDESEDEAE